MFSSASGRERSNCVTVLFGIVHTEGTSQLMVVT